MSYALGFMAFAFVIILMGQVNELKKRVATLEALQDRPQPPAEALQDRPQDPA
ncbi:MAG: hypothetical protein ACOY82_20965 [Pseudomonadota bacterium]